MIVQPLSGSRVAGGDFVIAEWVDDAESSAERPVAPLHRHLGDDEAQYVLEGALGFIRGDERLEAHAGSAVLVPAALVEAIHEPEARADLPGLFRRFDSELLG